MTNHSENINELAVALSKAQSEMSFAAKDSTNPHFKSKYADLSDVWDAIRQPLTKHGLSVTQLVDIHDGKPVLISLLMHSSGQWIKSTIPIINANNTSQGQGAGITYVRRYSLAALVGCVQDDDDGQSSMPKQQSKAAPKIYSPEPKEEEIKALPDISSQPLPNCIANGQVDMLAKAIKQCDDGYVSKFNKHMNDLGWLSFYHIPQSEYARIMTGIQKNIEMNKEK